MPRPRIHSDEQIRHRLVVVRERGALARIDDARTALLGGENSAVAHMLGVDKNAVNRIAGS